MSSPLSCPWSPIFIRRLRGVLAERQISHTTFAMACDLSRTQVCRILAGSRQPGALAQLKLLRGIEVLGLDREGDEPREGARHAC